MNATAAETHISPTPILDRLVPLPPPITPGSGLIIVIAVWLGVLITLAASVVLGRPPILRQWILIDFPHWVLGHWRESGIIFIAVSALGVCFAMVAVHEIGHVLGGLCAGFRFSSLRIGPLQFDRPFRMSFHRGPGAAINGVANIIPVTTDKLALRGLMMVLAGPAANILSGCAVLLLPFTKGFSSGLFIFASIANGLSDLLPFQSRLGVSDGRRIGMLLRNRERGERWLALTKLGAELQEGAMPEALPADFLAKAIAVRDHSEDTVTAHAFAYSAAFHQHKDVEAGQRLETCLQYSSYAAPALREALMSDAAVFQARRRKRADRAEQWLAEIPQTTPTSWLRSRAKAAILEARGDVDGALRKLDEYEKAILAFPNATRREILLRMLQRWKSELRRC